MSSPDDLELKNIREASNKNQDDTKNPRKVVILDGEDSSSTNRRVPVDKYNLVFAILLIHGIGTLMAWNIFINAQSYFRNYKLSPNNNGTSPSLPEQEEGLDDIRKNFLTYLGIASQIPNVLFNGLNLLVNMGSGNLKMRVNLTLVLEAIVFVITIVLAVMDSSKWKVTFFHLTMLSVVVANGASGIYQNCLFGLSAKFPGKYTNAILIGSNFSGTFTSIVDLLSIWLAPAPQQAAMYYFITALFIIFACIISFKLLQYNRFYRYYDSPDRVNEAHELIDETNNAPRATNTTSEPEPQVESTSATFVDELMKKWEVFLKCWPQCINVFFTFYITLALFPAVLANVKQSQDYFSDKYYTSFACFFIFNVFALIGNIASGWTTWPGKNHLWIAVFSRVAFVPFFLFCNFNPSGRHWPVLISNDLLFIVGNILFAFSSGYFSSLCMMFASSGLKPDETPKAGMLAAFFLVFGIFMGVSSSSILTWIVEIG